MRASRTVAGRVMRLYLGSLLLEALAIVLVGGALSVAVVLRRDDDGAIALARTLGSELTNHASESPSALDALVRHELEEERWFGRQIEVWKGAERVGGDARDGILGTYASGEDGCRSATIDRRSQRVCSARTFTGLVVVVASPIRPVLDSLAPVIGGVGIAAMVAILLTVLIGRRLVAVSLAPLSKFERRVAALQGVGTDVAVEVRWGVDEVDVLARTFNDLLERIRAAVTREKRFVADASHELRTPLTRLRGQLELAGAEIRAGEDPMSRIMAAARSCHQLITTTETLLALARNQASAEETLDMVDVVDACWAHLDGSEQARLRVETGDQQSVVRGDEALLRLAIGNLIDNALKYSAGPVVVQVAETVEGVSVSIDDCGPGIPPEDVERMREPFVRGTGASNGIRGAGLGLALVHHVAILHGGVLDIVNRMGGGLRARIRLAPWRPAPA